MFYVARHGFSPQKRLLWLRWQRQVRNGCSKGTDVGRNRVELSTNHCTWPSTPQQNLERRCIRLKVLLDRLRLPAITHFQAFGKDHELPVLADPKQQLRELFDNELSYLAGFFDGDGCVTPAQKLSGCTLSVSQSSHHAEALLLFRQAFGGSITMERPGQGSRKPTIAWRVCGRSARRAAATLSRSSLLKHSQLQIASDWPSCPSKREESAVTLKMMKATPKCSHLSCSWSYVAGFFDAEGYISVPPDQLGIRLGIPQKHPGILHIVHAFLKAEGILAIMYHEHSRHVSRLMVLRVPALRLMLTRMLAAGMHVKRKSAEVALAITPGRHAESRRHLAALAGNQGRYARLDSEGCQRSSAIVRMGQRSCYHASHGRHNVSELLEKQLLELRREHALCNANTRVHRLRADIRSLLQLGASLVM
ncbi:unnamed protein product [Polarella glacialis]|uniref:LAGLIDADG endonuclease n=1 Tax=Polarella glacialis TaxID=89957 RepID=A0A813KPT4_POLGL|nr:unnamed protein product [Polarella glacialis]